MNIPQEFEDVFRGVELTEDEIRTLTWITGWERRTVKNLRSAIQKAQATALSTLQTENKKLRAELEKVMRERDAAQSLLAERIGVRGAEPITTAFGLPIDRLRELAQADREGKVPRYTIGDTVYDRCGEPWQVVSAELHSMRTKNEWLYRCGHEGTDDYRALWHFEAFPSREAALRREQDG